MPNFPLHLWVRSKVATILIRTGASLPVVGWTQLFAAQSLVQRVDQPESESYSSSGALLPAVQGAVWAVAPAADGSLLVGSNALSVFDGVHWTRLSVPDSAYAFRALAKGHNSRVWVGGINALGYADRNSAGEWRFTSLMSELQRVDRNPLGDIWTVQAAGACALWVASDRIVRWTPDPAPEIPGPEIGAKGKFEVWTRSAKLRLIAFPDSAGLWVFQEGQGILHVGAEGSPRLVCPAADLPAQPLTWIAAARNATGPTLVGLGDKAYAWDGARGFRHFERLSAALRGKVPTTAMWLDDRRLAIGTFKAGILLVEEDANPTFSGANNEKDPTVVVATISSTNGLEEDKINTLWADGAQLWVGSTESLVRISGAGRALWFERKTDLAKGVPHSVLEHEGATFIATSKQLFRLDANGSLTPVASTQPELMDAASIGTEIWTSGFGGVWHGGESGRAQCFHTAGDAPCVAASQRIPDGALILDGYELKALQPSATGIAVHNLGVRVSDTPVALFEDASGDVWVSTLVAGIRRFGWRDSSTTRLQLRLKANYRPRLGLPHDADGARLWPVGARFFAFAESGILELNANGTAFESVPELKEFWGVAAVAAAPPGADRPTASDPDPERESYWVVRLKTVGEIDHPATLRVRSRTKGPLRWEPVFVPGLERVGAITRVDWIAGTPDPVLWFSGNHGTLSVEVSALRRAPPSVPLQNITLKDARNPPREFGAATVALGPDVRRLSFDYRVPTAVSGATAYYQTWLEGIDDTWTQPTRMANRTFDNLAPGRYTFRVRTIDPFGQTGPSQTRNFSVLAPWWRTVPAISGYAIIALVTGAGLARWRVRQLRRQNERLNRLVVERTREIELASTAKSEFLENISHEIRNPLNGLSGLLNLMKEERFDPHERELARSLRTVAGELQRVFEEVLGFSKLEYGYTKLRKRPFRLHRSLEELIELFAPVARQQRCSLRLEWSALDDDAFEGDESKVKTVISNFVSNALKYAPGGPIVIRVDANPRDNGAVELYIEVRDSGPGVPAEEQEVIFKKFVRGSNAARDGVPGTGLGLATCRVLAQIMHGNVGIESPITPTSGTAPACGSLFYLRLLLPRARVGEPPPDKPPVAVATAPSGLPQAGTRDVRALIVEDEPYNQIVLEGIALELGCRADVAGHAAEAWEKLESRDYSIIFLDWELPGGNGGEIARRLRTRPGGSLPLILAVTAHDSDEIRAQCFAAGMDGFLLKPYDVSVVRTMLDRASARRNGVAPRALGELSSNRDALPAADSGEQTLNLSAFAQYARARPDSSHSAPELFARAVETELQAITTALGQADSAALANGAHRLRALAGLINARPLLDAAHALETIARQDSRESFSSAVATTAAAVVQMVTQIRSLDRS